MINKPANDSIFTSNGLTYFTSTVKNIKRLVVTMAATAVLTPAVFTSQAYASDWTTDAYSGCQVRLGNATPYRSGFRASGGTAVLSCPITKKAGSSNLNFVYARMKRATTGSAIPFCTLNSNSHYSSTSSNSTWGYASSTTSAHSVAMPLPTLYSTGYLNLVCVIYENDIFFGYRYNQD